LSTLFANLLPFKSVEVNGKDFQIKILNHDAGDTYLYEDSNIKSQWGIRNSSIWFNLENISNETSKIEWDNVTIKKHGNICHVFWYERKQRNNQTELQGGKRGKRRIKRKNRFYSEF
jgi:hypothetical protein